MKNLATQEEFEILLGKGNNQYDLPALTVIWFSAAWCGPCRNVDIKRLQELFPANWLKCDIDQNDYTPGYCGIRSVPTFLVVYKTKIVGQISSSTTNEILNYLQNIQLK